ncbi:hypothetical protein KBY84_04295 [Cyanobium sp. N.Huapi 1H5]|uniref:hypothetical protein n=1 Tax=Cyanobium sp. N.Huapi 1H5 TaxID=2823719 RepID=UPI0020CD58A5|nr:hypothetical protein [Cyanobium sp. N.Huapi 1H5]MCP9836714.1 hypothetical protein [Cyanobium sp. N.Huapi 1H5]
MHVQVRLLHCDGGRRVVLVSARDGERFLGSALGEAGDAEEAEDRARARLLARLQDPGPAAAAPERVSATFTPAPAADTPAPPPKRSVAASEPLLAAPPQAAPPQAAPPTAPPPPPGPPASAEPGYAVATPAPPAPPTPDEDPQDWSAELTHLDLQLRRLGWDRDREAAYLQRCFGHPSRDRITVYADLIAYLQAVETLEPGCDPASAPVPLRRSDLLEQCNLLLQQLGWDGGMGRSFLEQHLGVSSRQQLKDADLLRFNMLLEEETLRAADGGAAAPGPDG